MGIPKFFRWISERYPLCSELVTENRVPEFDCLYLDMNGVIHQCSHSSDEKLVTVRDESDIFLSVFAYVQALFDKIRPQKLLFLAVDGVAPRAKMNQQRSRRFRTAAEKAEAEEQARKKEEAAARAAILHDPTAANLKTPAKYFDTNCITPGTDFMVQLSAHLCYFIAKRVDEDPAWRSVKIVFSGPECPGEGEHKIMEWIRAERARPDHDSNLRHCLYGLDADLIMLGLLSHEPHFALLREEVKFGRGSRDKGKSALRGADQVRFHLMFLGVMRNYLENEFGMIASTLSIPYDFERVLDDFVLLSLFVGNDFIPHLPHLHINENALGILFEAYKKTLPQLDGYLNDGGRVNMARCARVLQTVMDVERQVFESECADELEERAIQKSNRKKDKGRDKASVTTTNTAPPANQPLPITPKQRAIFDDFVRNFLRRDDVSEWTVDPALIAEHPEDRVFVAGLAKDFLLLLEFTEDHSFILRKASESDSESDAEGWQFTLDTGRIVARYERRPVLSELDPQRLGEAIVDTEDALWESWKARYYAEKMEIRDATARDALMQKYCEGLEWVMAYYYEGVASWGWFFPYHYAPFLSDLVAFLIDGRDGGLTGRYRMAQFELGQPFAPLEQLMGVLPSLSAALVPAPLATLMTDPASPILHFFPTTFSSDMNGKKNSWEAVVKIPFIEADLLLATLQARYGMLSEAERMRNAFGPAFTFVWEDGPQGKHELSPPSATFPPLVDCRVHRVIIDIARPERDELRRGLTPGVATPPGFPTLSSLPHTPLLQNLAVCVFDSGQPARGLTLGLVIDATGVAQWRGDLRRFVAQNRTVHIHWPHLLEAQLEAVTDGERIYRANSDQAAPVTADWLRSVAGVDRYERVIETMEETLRTRRGVILAGGIEMLALVRPFRRMRMRLSDGAIEKEFDPAHVELVPLQLLVTQLAHPDPRFIARPPPGDPAAPLANCFPPGETVIHVGSLPNVAFGAAGVVEGPTADGRRMLVRFAAGMDPSLPEAARAMHSIVAADLERQLSEFVDARDAARRLDLPPWLLSKLTSAMQVLPAGSTRGAPVCIGLSVKFEGRGRAVPHLARRVGPGHWLYSHDLIRTVAAYHAAFPDLFSALIRQGPGMDRPSADALFSRNAAARLTEVRAWLRERGFPSPADATKSCDGVQILSSKGVRELMARVDRAIEADATRGRVTEEQPRVVAIPPANLVTRHTGSLYALARLINERPGKAATASRNQSNGSKNGGKDGGKDGNRSGSGSVPSFQPGERVVWTGDGADGVPFGAVATVVAIMSGGDALDDCGQCWIVLDHPLRGIATDLDGLLEGSLAQRGLIVRTERLLSASRGSTEPATERSDNSDAVKFLTKIMAAAALSAEKERHEEGTVGGGKGNKLKVKSDQKPTGKPVVVANKPAPSAATVMQPTPPAAVAAVKQQRASPAIQPTPPPAAVAAIQSTPTAPVVTVKKKTPSTATTAKISYSTASHSVALTKRNEQ